MGNRPFEFHEYSKNECSKLVPKWDTELIPVELKNGMYDLMKILKKAHGPNKSAAYDSSIETSSFSVGLSKKVS